MATLTILDGPASGQKFALEKHPLLMIGRSEECTFQVLDSRVSRKHLQLRFDEDTGRHQAINYSRSGDTLIDGKAITEPTGLTDGMQIRIGDTTMLYTETDSADAQTAREAWFRKGQQLKTMTGQDDGPSAQGIVKPPGS